MAKAIELAKQHGMRYFFIPQGTLEMHGTDQQIEAVADDVRKAALLEAVRVFEKYLTINDIEEEIRRMAEGG